MLLALPGSYDRAYNASAPLNVGRKLWLLAQPQQFGGARWADLASGQNHGVLSGFTASNATTAGWRPTTRKGGWGHIVVDGASTTFVQHPFNGTVNWNGPLTMAMWAYIVAAPPTNRGALWGLGSGANVGDIFAVDPSGALGLFRPGTSIYLCFATFTYSAWGRVLFTYGAGGSNNGVLYFNGVQVSTTNAGSQISTAITTGYVGSSINQSNPLPPPAGTCVDSLSLWSRILSPTEAAADYAEEVAGYPTTLPRRSAWAGLASTPLSASVFLSSAYSLGASGQLSLAAGTVLNSSGTAAASGRLSLVASASLSSQSSDSAAATTALQAGAGLASSGALSASARVSLMATAALSSTSTDTAAAVAGNAAGVAIGSSGSLIAGAALSLDASAGLSSWGSLAPHAALVVAPSYPPRLTCTVTPIPGRPDPLYAVVTPLAGNPIPGRATVTPLPGYPDPRSAKVWPH